MSEINIKQFSLQNPQYKDTISERYGHKRVRLTHLSLYKLNIHTEESSSPLLK
jgi:hypothetical protein